MSCFGDEFAGVLLQMTMGQGSQEPEQQDERSEAADKAIQARKPARAKAANRRLRISNLKPSGPAGEFRVFGIRPVRQEEVCLRRTFKTRFKRIRRPGRRTLTNPTIVL